MSSLGRRAFVAALAAAGRGARTRLGAAPRRPNILFAVADDQSWLHTGSAGDPVVRTPAIDSVAARGVRFTHAFCCSPSCTPSRGAMLTGQDIWRLGEGGNLWSTLPARFEVYPGLLESAGYRVGFERKGWGPGRFEPGGRTRNPAGPQYASFEEFHAGLPGGVPFCFWFGSHDPHRPYQKGSGLAAGMKAADVRVPSWLPDHPDVRADILDYYFAIQRFDRDLGRILDLLRQSGRLENTLVVVTADNGMPFPRAKTNLYDSGTRMPLAVSWPARVPPGRVVDDMISHADLAPTFLEAAGLKPRPAMTGRSFLDVLTSSKQGRVDPARDRVVTGRERHTNMRSGGAGYPMRALRTYDLLYIRNYERGRWPAGDPPDYGDIDNSPSKEVVIEGRSSPAMRPFFEMACAKRPAEELYDLRKDPAQQVNVAGHTAYAAARKSMSEQLTRHLVQTGDPRETGGPANWDTWPYYGQPNAQKRGKP